MPLFSLIVPLCLIGAFAGFRGMIEIWPAALVAGLSFAIFQFIVSNYHGPWLVDVIAAITGWPLVGLFQPDPEVDPVDSQVDVVLVGQAAPLPARAR